MDRTQKSKKGGKTELSLQQLQNNNLLTTIAFACLYLLLVRVIWGSFQLDMFKEKKTIFNVFQKPVDPKELVRKWQAQLRTEQRQIDRQIRDIQRSERETVKAVKQAAQRNDLASAKVLAKEIARARKTVTQFYTQKATLTSMSTALMEQLAIAKVSGSLSKSTEVMQQVQDLIKVPELMKTMQEMSKEMMKFGVIEEMIADTIDDAIDEDDLEEETQEQLDQILVEITGETLAQLPQANKTQIQQPVEEEPEQEEEDQEELRQRLEAIRS
eukprot:TRINITY_DN423_c0_g1_i1.p1 TRINITY_DN423_c0_g1~~TRINITY_DN423_c0_g1_i1.p1  ORF type:complete len:271 (+),score=41.10 TRINITY_DN423_c0_g1_i1:127-939(+)